MIIKINIVPVKWHNNLEVIFMTGKNIPILFFAILFIFTTTFLGGCNEKSENSPPESSETKKEPQELEKITKNIELIIKEVEKKQELAKKPPEEKSPPSEKSQGEPKDKENQQDKKQEDPLQNWDKEEKYVTEIHEKWNVLEIEATKEGADDALKNEFETNLDTLTDHIMAKNIMDTLISANELYGSTTKIADLYKTSNPPEADMMKYYTQKALFAIEEEDWTKAAESAQSIKSPWKKVKIKMGEKGAKLINPMEYSIEDFDKAIEKENKEVATIKGNIVLSNIEKVIKEVEKSQEK